MTETRLPIFMRLLGREHRRGKWLLHAWKRTVLKIGSDAQFEPLYSRFEFIVDHNRSGFLGVNEGAIRVKALPIVKSLLGAAGETTIRYGSRSKDRSVGKQVAREGFLSDITAAPHRNPLYDAPAHS